MKIPICIFSICVLLSASACNTGPLVGMDNERLYLQSFVPEYIDGNLVAEAALLQWLGSEEIVISCSLAREGYQRYSCAEVGGTGAALKQFLKIAERNGDRSFNREDNFLNYINRSCLAWNITAIEVTCPKKAWDTQHEAGVSLNDIARINAMSYAPYVRNGYTGEQSTQISTLLTGLRANDLFMIQKGFNILLEGSPAAGSYEIEIRVTTVDDGVKTVACMVELK